MSQTLPPRPSRAVQALGLAEPTPAEALEARLSMALTAALGATTAKKHLVAAALATKQGRPADADALLVLGQALEALGQTAEETEILRNTLVDRRSATQKHAARWSRFERVPRTSEDPRVVLAAIAAALKTKNAA